jgi:beta-phosphoglucomutase
MPRAILFDFDGTIVLSEPLHFRAFAEVLGRRGITLSEPRYAERYLGLTDRECVARMIEDLSLREPGDVAGRLLAEKAEAMKTEISRGVPLCPGVETFVAAARERGALAVVSCGLRGEIRDVLARTGLDGFFSVVVSAEDVRAGKPDPEGYRLGWHRLRSAGLRDLTPAECLVVEDSPRGIDAALAAEMRVIALPHTCTAEELAAADRVYDSYSQVSWPELERLFRCRTAE